MKTQLLLVSQGRQTDRRMPLAMKRHECNKRKQAFENNLIEFIKLKGLNIIDDSIEFIHHQNEQT